MSRWNKVILAYERPDLLEGWDYENNKDICSPEDVAVGSHVRVWWKCENGHSWIAEIRRRVGGEGCPYCAGNKILSGVTDLETLRPDLLNEWDYQKNTISPQNVGIGCHRKVWWICSDCGYNWEAVISNRARGSGCPICATKKRNNSNSTADYNQSLAKQHPELIKEWDYEKNTKIDPNRTYPGTQKKAWWICSKCGNHYYASIANRSKGAGCPVCAGKKIVPGLNDLKTWCNANDKQFILEEWDYSKNSFTPSDVAPFANKKAWFICREGHSFQAAISNRATNNTGCPVCEHGRKTSFPEQAVYYYVKERYPNAVSSYHASWLGQLELDVFIPELKTAIEYDGVTWHADEAKDLRKSELCAENGVQLIRIRENGLAEVRGNTNVSLKANTKAALDEAIEETLRILGCNNIIVNTERDTPHIVKQFDKSKKEKSIAELFPELLSEWDYDKNAGIDPHFINYGSARKFWWRCPVCNNSWQMSPSNRTHLGQGCPKCAGTKKAKTHMETLVKNRGSLEDAKLPLLDEWDYERNTVLPSQVTKGSKRKVWWKCKTCGGSWMAQVYSRTKENGTGCPYCTGRKVLNGFNDLTVTHPELISEWNYDKNTGKTPDMYTAGSSEKIWWKCKTCGHEWQAAIDTRSAGRKCPKCQRKKVASNQQVKVINLDTGVVYDSLLEAAKSCNGRRESICSCCKGNSKTAYGYRWAYVGETGK